MTPYQDASTAVVAQAVEALLGKEPSLPTPGRIAHEPVRDRAAVTPHALDGGDWRQSVG